MDDAAPPVLEEPPARDWSLLPLDALASIFVRVGAVNVLMGAGLVCRSWLDAAKLPDVWRVLDLGCDNHMYGWRMNGVVWKGMLKSAVDRSDGQLRVLYVFNGYDAALFMTDELLQYTLERSPGLTTLELSSCFDDVLSKQLISKIRDSPLLKLRYLELSSCFIDFEDLLTLLENCPALKVLRVWYTFSIHEYHVHELRAKFPKIKTIEIKCEDCQYGSSCESDD